jgi:hypothetical protein
MPFRGLLLLAIAAAIACAPVSESAAAPAAPTGLAAPWSTERAVAALRTALRARPSLEDAVVGPMLAVTPDDHLRREAGRAVLTDPLLEWWPPGALLVETQAGRWWVWPGGATAPADRAARRYAELMPAGASLEHVVEWP